MTRIIRYLLLFLILLSGCGERLDPAVELDRLIEKEIAFASASGESGMVGAFLAFLADDGVLFRPGPVNGKEWFEENRENPGRLDREPAIAGIAASCDLGYTAGPWEFRSSAEDGAVSHGHFVTFWAKQADGEWKVAINGGNSYEERVDGPAGEVERQLPSAAVNAPGEADESVVKRARSEIYKIDHGIGRATFEKGIAGGILGLASKEILLFRMNAPPLRGKEGVEEAYGGMSGVLRVDPQLARVSAAGDLGYTFGTFEHLTGTNDPVYIVYSFLHGWRREAGGEWRLFIDLADPLPE